MKYTLHSIKYSAKNFIYLFPLCVIPAFFLAFTVARTEMFSVWEAFWAKDLSSLSFVEIFQVVSIFNFSSWEAVLGGLIGFIALVLCVALLMAFTDKHMRIGKRTFNGLFSKLNDNLLSTFGFAALLFFIYEVWSLLTAALFYLLAQLPFVAALATSTLLYFGAHVILLFVVSCIYLWLPCMQITGFKPFEALRYSNILCEAIKWRIVFNQFVILFVAEICVVVSVLCLPHMQAASFFVTTIVYALLIMLFCVRMQVAYLDRTKTERADLVPYYTV
ncbi:MAG: hypothetical protein IJX81_07025 [Clostridia bacterium]|nr:hypothetical protein [Clostridia bacterium]